MWQKILDMFNTMKEFIYRILLSLYDMFKDVFIWIYDSVLGLIASILNGIGNLFDGLNVAQYFEAIPADVANVMSLIGFGQATGIIIGAITIRLILQLIPFTRLGS